MYLPDMANPLKPTANTRKEMATPLLWEYPTTSNNVASMPNPNRERQQVTHAHKAHGLLVFAVSIELSMIHGLHSIM